MSRPGWTNQVSGRLTAADNDAVAAFLANDDPAAML